MRLSIECNGCKATLTSGSNLTPVTTKKAKIKKEPRDAEYEKSCKPKKKSLSELFELSSSSSSEGEVSSFGPSEYYGKIKNRNKKKDSVAAAAVKVSRGVAVVEQSSDPYGDFRRSMVEMILARQKLSGGDLNRLLRSYLTLNPPQHHPVILKAFSDLFVGGSLLNV